MTLPLEETEEPNQASKFHALPLPKKNDSPAESDKHFAHQYPPLPVELILLAVKSLSHLHLSRESKGVMLAQWQTFSVLPNLL